MNMELVAANTAELVTSILIVGARRTCPDSGAAPRVEGFHFCCYDELTVATLMASRPAIVISPLVGDGFDAIDVAQRLAAIGFSGGYRAVAEPLPRKDVVLAEVRLAAPGLDVDLLPVSALTRR